MHFCVGSRGFPDASCRLVGYSVDRSVRLWTRISNNECNKPAQTMQESKGLFEKSSMQRKLSVTVLKAKSNFLFNHFEIMMNLNFKQQIFSSVYITV